jgi:hypothetical protein
MKWNGDYRSARVLREGALIPRSTNRPIRSATFRADEGNSENIRLDILLRNQAAMTEFTDRSRSDRQMESAFANENCAPGTSPAISLAISPAGSQKSG